jgi:hypothetical protein
MAHDSSLPIGDRGEAADPEQPRERRPAIVILLRTGSFFRAFRPNGSVVEMRVAARAKIFSPDAKAIAATLAKLRRKGVAGSVIEVQLVIGGQTV